MIIWKQRFLPVKGYKAVFFAGILFVRKEVKMIDKDMNHEKIHSHQFAEMSIIGLIISSPFAVSNWWALLFGILLFYVWYGVEFVIRLIKIRNRHVAYKSISFEREAYQNDDNLQYLEKRKKFAFIKYLWY